MKTWNNRIILLLCGNYGILCYFEKLDGITFHKWFLSLWVTGLTCGMWYLYFRRKKWISAVAFVSAGAAVLCMAAGHGTLEAQVRHLGLALTDEPNLEPRPVSLLFLLGMSVIAILLFVFEIVLRKHMIPCLVTVVMLLFGPMAGIPANMTAVVLLLLFQTALFMEGLERPAAVLALILFAVSFLTVYVEQETLYSFAYDGEHFVHNTVKWLTGTADEASASGTIEKGNQYKTGTVQLEIEMNSPPVDDLYLRGFSGDEYVGGRWQEASDNEILAEAVERLGWQRSMDNVSIMYSSMYYTLNTFLSGSGIPPAKSATIVHTSRHYRRYFQPYGGQWTSDTYAIGYRAYMTYTGYTYRFYEQRDMDIDWSNVRGGFARQAQMYGSLQDAYMEVIGEAYLDVPEDRLPRLTQLCRENPLEDQDEITAFIISTLNSNTSYTLTPGNAPVNKDIVEYFLFDSGKGYCQHYASVAALMYRMYGIPARYVSGYRISASDFELEKGMYRAHVTDESAHAWVEIFIKDYGWVPIEVTPSEDGRIRTSYPGFDGEKLAGILNKYQWSMEAAKTPQEDGTENFEQEEDQEDKRISIQIPWEEYKEYLWSLAAILIYTICMIPFFLSHRRLKYLEKMQKRNCREVYYRLLQMLRDTGYYRTDTGTGSGQTAGMEEDLADRLAEKFPDIRKEEIRHMMEILERAAYSPKAPERQEEMLVLDLYLRMEEQIYERLGRCRRLIFRYIKRY